MLTLDIIKNNTEEVIARLAIKHFDGREKINRIIELDKTRRASQNELDARLAELKKLAGEIGKLMKEGNKEMAEEVKARVADIKAGNVAIEEAMVTAEKEITELLLTIPNLPRERGRGRTR